jgi:hypothetical protein
VEFDNSQAAQLSIYLPHLKAPLYEDIKYEKHPKNESLEAILKDRNEQKNKREKKKKEPSSHSFFLKCTRLYSEIITEECFGIQKTISKYQYFSQIHYPILSSLPFYHETFSSAYSYLKKMKFNSDSTCLNENSESYETAHYSWKTIMKYAFLIIASSHQIFQKRQIFLIFCVGIIYFLKNLMGTCNIHRYFLL